MTNCISRIGSRNSWKPWLGLWVAIISAISCGEVSAQYTYGSGIDGISVTGTGRVELKPKKLRLNMWIEAPGKDVKSAVKALASHQERVREDLVAMNADVDSIRFSTVRFKGGESQQQQQAIRMMQLQMGSASLGVAEEDALPEIVTARAALQVEWELPTTDVQALAILPEGLKSQIASRDLAGKKNQPDLTEEQLEQLNEMSTMLEESMGGYSYGESSDSTGPNIVFVAQASPEQRQAAMKQAFDQAHESAELISAAAGTELGALKSIAVSGQESEMMQAIRYAGYGGSESYPFAASPGELTAATLDELVVQIALMAVYEM